MRITLPQPKLLSGNNRKKMFNKVLIANRGAIATRVIRTLKKMEIRSVVVYSEADRYSLHVSEADEAYSLGEGTTKETYLDIHKIINVAKEAQAEAIHPGYGFLSENPEFARVCSENNIQFLGPTSDQIITFGLKHTAREMAEKSNVPLLQGTGLLADPEEAKIKAQEIGFPVILKSSAGGGGIGMQVCRNLENIEDAFESVKRLSANNFNNDGVFLEQFIENARHIEVQIFGDGNGHVVHLGERDCSTQRRNQKVIEEAPAQGIPNHVKQEMFSAAISLGKLVNYRNAGTVEYLLDKDTNRFFFLEMNTRLQVEHGVTEEITGVDLVEWMVKAGCGELDLSSYHYNSDGCAIQVRVYAEDPDRNFMPCTGIISELKYPYNTRVESWISAGVEISPFFDPMLAKIIVKGENRQQALHKLNAALDNTTINGVEHNLSYVKSIINTESFKTKGVTTSFLNKFEHPAHSIIVLEGGTETTIQDVNGRIGYWNVGIPPSGPMDMLSAKLANAYLSNPQSCALMEITFQGPTLQFLSDVEICITGADMGPTINGNPVSYNKVVRVKKNDRLAFDTVKDTGMRAYLAIAGGFDVPYYMGSKSTFKLGKFGGHKGRNLHKGDKLNIASTKQNRFFGINITPPPITHHWTIGVMYGPHGAPDFFYEEYLIEFLNHNWEVHFNSSRTGVRLIGPTPSWSREDGGEAGLHPSNIHDNAYAVGAIDFTGDMPIILGPDGPSLGGFVCPFTIINAELWKIGQLKPGDTIQFQLTDIQNANSFEQEQRMCLEQNTPLDDSLSYFPLSELSAILKEFENSNNIKAVYRQAGDKYLLLEYGEMTLDLNLRFYVHVLMEKLLDENIEGILELTPGIRSLQIHYESLTLPQKKLIQLLERIENELATCEDVTIPSRIIHLPLSWDDPATQLAIEKYLSGVRPDAPWGPSNIEFIRRINGLKSIEDVYDIAFNASYLVLGLGDVYLGAPVATPLDPRHRLVTTKYNPARTWTPENAVGIGGAYMCIYGMEGPGGYQFIGRTIPVWNSFAHSKSEAFTENKPWLLRFFDQIKFYPVTAEELEQQRKDFIHGVFKIKIEKTSFNLRKYNSFLESIQGSARRFKEQQQRAFNAERCAWKEKGLDEFIPEPNDSSTDLAHEETPEGCQNVHSMFPGSIWKVEGQLGASVNKGDVLFVGESMKMEFPIVAPCNGVMEGIFIKEGEICNTEQVLAWIKETE